MTPEVWDAQREMFIFHCHPAAKLERWTFCVPRSTLEAIKPDCSLSTAAMFNRLRARIYKAARHRMHAGCPREEQIISASEITPPSGSAVQGSS
jgi:hypothetical protein